MLDAGCWMLAGAWSLRVVGFLVLVGGWVSVGFGLWLGCESLAGLALGKSGCGCHRWRFGFRLFQSVARLMG